MRLIAGLGNPGRQYLLCRHNLGFCVVRGLAKKYKIHLKKDLSTKSLKGIGNILGNKIILALPLTYMNLSGIGVDLLVKKYKLDLKSLLIICDDLDLELGKIRLRKRGSAGGHLGLTSIIKTLNTKEFSRLRIGVDRPPKGQFITNYVLSNFTESQLPSINKSIQRAIECCEVWIKEGIDKTMSRFN